MKEIMREEEEKKKKKSKAPCPYVLLEELR